MIGLTVSDRYTPRHDDFNLVNETVIRCMQSFHVAAFFSRKQAQKFLTGSDILEALWREVPHLRKREVLRENCHRKTVCAFVCQKNGE